MFASASGNRSGADKEAERLQTISIPQQFGWTGLTKETTTDLAMEGLVLWNVLGFALADERDYFRFTQVNKEWNAVVQKLIPPALFCIKKAIERRGDLTLEHVGLLKEIRPSLEDKNSPLYRKRAGSKEEEEEGKWPDLQPQFNLILMRLVNDAATQRSHVNWSHQIYALVCEYLQEYSHKMFQKMVESLDNNSSFEEKLGRVLGLWNHWDAVVSHVDGIASFLNRYFVRHHGLITIKEQAQVHLEQELLRVADGQTKLESFLGSISGNNMESMSPSLLVKAFCATKLPIPRSPVLRQWNQIQHEYGRIKAFANGLMEQQKEPVKEEEEEGTGLAIFFPDGTKLEASTHFVKSSGFLTNLKLTKGDTLRWDRDEEKEAFAKAIEFYAMDERNPMPPIVHMRSTVLSAVVGEEYATFCQSLEQHQLFGLITLANTLHTKKLLG